MKMKMKGRQQISIVILIILMVFENLFLYYFFRNGILSTGVNAIGLFLSSLLFGIVALSRFYNVTAEELTTRPAKGNIIAYISTFLVLAGITILGIQYSTFFPAAKLLNSTSDIIPCIQIACRRLIHGEFAYKVITDFGYPQWPNYFPMHWMPFTIAELLHIDYRWITYGAWCIAALVLCIRSLKIPSITLRALTPLLIFSSFYVLQTFNLSILEITVEVLIASYYMMLITSLNQRSGILQGIIIYFCLLSRFSLVLWLPLYAFVLFVTNNKKQLYTAVITSVSMVIILYVIPFLSKDWEILFRGFKYYDTGTYAEWTHIYNGQPLHLFRGTGYAYFFYTRFPNLDVMSRIKLLQRVELFSSLLLITLMGIWFWFNKHKINTRMFLISSFKIYLAVFLFLIQVPYEYLMCVGNFVSIAVFCEQARYRISYAKN